MTKRMIKYSLIMAVLSIMLTGLSLTAAPQVRAAGWWDKVNEGGLNDVGQAYGVTGGNVSASSDIRLTIARMIRIALEFLGILFLIIIIVAGFRWMTAGGDEEKVTAARKLLLNSVIGLVIIFAAYSIDVFVFNQIQFATTGIQPVTWW